jgi:hypothetical protein
VIKAWREDLAAPQSTARTAGFLPFALGMGSAQVFGHLHRVGMAMVEAAPAVVDSLLGAQGASNSDRLAAAPPPPDGAGGGPRRAAPLRAERPTSAYVAPRGRLIMISEELAAMIASMRMEEYDFSGDVPWSQRLRARTPR